MNSTQTPNSETSMNEPTAHEKTVEKQTIDPNNSTSPTNPQEVDELVPAPSSDEMLKQQISKLEEKLATSKEDILRMAAEMENVRKRSQEEISKASKFAIERFAESMIPVIDSLEAASLDNSGNIEMLKKGIDLTLNQLLNAFEHNQLKAISPSKGQAYDPRLHQAISMIESEQEANTIVDLLQKGYEISGRILRPSMVTVSKPKTTT